MDIVLKNVKTHNDMSEETTCFSASIYLDGRRVGTVSNHGTGGCNDYHWENRDAGRRIDSWADEQEMEFNFEKLDQIIDQLRVDFENKKQFRRWCKKDTGFSLRGDEEGHFRTIRSVFTPEVKEHLVNKYGDKIERILNEEL